MKALTIRANLGIQLILKVFKIILNDLSDLFYLKLTETIKNCV